MFQSIPSPIFSLSLSSLYLYSSLVIPTLASLPRSPTRWPSARSKYSQSSTKLHEAAIIYDRAYGKVFFLKTITDFEERGRFLEDIPLSKRKNGQRMQMCGNRGAELRPKSPGDSRRTTDLLGRGGSEEAAKGVGRRYLPH